MATGFEHVFPPELAWMRPFPMDGALLLFDRESGTNVLCDGPETAPPPLKGAIWPNLTGSAARP